MVLIVNSSTLVAAGVSVVVAMENGPLSVMNGGWSPSMAIFLRKR